MASEDLKLYCETKPQESGRRGIIIQLTGTEGEWDSLDDNKLVITLDKDSQKCINSAPKQQPTDTDEEQSLHSPLFHVTQSGSSPGSLEDCSFSRPGFLSPSHRPLSSLVKSLSTELELRDKSSLKPRPLLSLVKSISTELSRSDPEVSQSKSGSKLNLHLWTQLTQSKGRNGDSRTAPPSPVHQSSSETKTGFFKLELEDTRRKLSEAMHEPFNVLSKMMLEESVGGSKHKTTSSLDSLCSKGFGRSSGEPGGTENLISSSKILECDGLPMCRCCRKCLHISCHSASHLGLLESAEVSTHEDTFKGKDKINKNNMSADCATEQPSSPVPCMGLFCVAVISYCYFILPLSSYCSGIVFGLAFGFLLGLLLIHLGLTRQPYTAQQRRCHEKTYDCIQSRISESSETVIKGWLNQMFVYDPETYHPSLMHSVYATLDGPCIRLDYPLNNISHWATFNELVHDQSFTYSRTFQLIGSKVFLLPMPLARKRTWNRKYPICVTLAREVKPSEEVEVQHEAPITEKTKLYLSKTSHTSTLYLFGRTGREKEEWFHYLLLASMYKKEGQHDSTDIPVLGEGSTFCPVQVTTSTENISCPSLLPDDHAGKARNILLDYTSYMTNLLFSADGSPPPSSWHDCMQGSPNNNDQNAFYHQDELQLAWINVLIGRIFWDFLREKYWADQVQHKIQRKLSKIKLPYFMDDLTLTELSMGSCMPQITGTFLPRINAKGLWLPLEIVYTGALQMTLETKINLSRLGKEGSAVRNTETHQVYTRSKLAVLADSDEESSSAGSTDEDEAQSSEPEVTIGEKASVPNESVVAGGSTGRRILRFVDKIAKSRCFQKAAENEYIKKKIEKMSNMPLLLTVEVKELSGTLSVNIPPPPTDRIWYGFCEPPKLDLRVRPKLGEREVTFCHVTEWIEKMLQDEFQKVFVLPNMDDIYLPLMCSAQESQPSPQHSPLQRSDKACVLDQSPQI
ncbi:testis-expressed protein 2 [Trichomycterus rosablanca]|uniref:testis-expressed protein 2 n=1 Tax=Trichomycterus rosablanca TaxID=2290929 RepID=UPI002F360716